MKKIVIAEDEDLQRHYIVKDLKAERASQYEVVGEARDGLELLNLWKTHKPDILIIDLNMPKISGYDAIVRIRKVDTEVKIIVLTSIDETTSIRELYSLVDSYLVKSKETPAELLKTIDKLALFGGSEFRKYILNVIFTPDTAEKKELSPREVELLYFIKQNLSNKEIASKLFITLKAVEKLTSSIFKKFSVKSRNELLHKMKDVNFPF